MDLLLVLHLKERLKISKQELAKKESNGFGGSIALQIDFLCNTLLVLL